MSKHILKPKFLFECCYNISSNKCVCDETILLQKRMKKYMKQLNDLPIIHYNNAFICYSSINSFVTSSKTNNDKNNKIRENIVGAFINGYISEEYPLHSRRWRILKNSILDYIHDIAPDMSINNLNLIHRGGRNFNYDFTFIINEIHEFNIELKYNASTVKESPQFISPMKPSKYMSSSYEEYFYDNYLPKLADKSGFDIPERDTYLAKIHSNAPSCMLNYQELYYKGCKQSSKFTGDLKDIEFYEYSKKIDNESRSKFIESNELNIDLLSTYLKETQQNKIYMLYKNFKFYKEYVNMDDYILTNYKKYPSKYMFVSTSKSNRKIKILLRWKNGNGIAYPAFQIS
jgi:hypothetical protein